MAWWRGWKDALSCLTSGKGKFSILCLTAWISPPEGWRKNTSMINFDNPTRREIRTDLRFYPHPFIIMRCYNVNIQYLPCNKSVSVHFPSTKREARDSCLAGDLIAWTGSHQPNTLASSSWRVAGADGWYIWGAGIIQDKIEKGSSNKSRLLYFSQ